MGHGNREGYVRFPAIRGETVVFVTEDDLWTVSASGGEARRLTADLTEVSHPVISPNGEMIAFTSSAAGVPDVYVMDAAGGPARRLTWLGDTATRTLGFFPDGRVLFTSATSQPFGRHTLGYAVPTDGGPVERLRYGPVTNVAFGPSGAVLLGRNTGDPARWKRYRGGTAGRFWLDRTGSGEFVPLLADLEANLACPMWVGERIYFISDHEGIGNLYSCRPDGGDLRRHTDHDEFYARWAATDGERIVYQHAAAVWLFDPREDTSRPLEARLATPHTQRARRFVSTREHLGAMALHPTGEAIVADVRGKLVSMPCWEGAARQHGEPDGVRYVLASYLGDGGKICAVSDSDGEEGIDVFDLEPNAEALPRRFASGRLGRVLDMEPSPSGSQLAVTNNRNALLIIDVSDGSVRTADTASADVIDGVCWSPDGAWLAYSFPVNRHSAIIKLLRLSTGETYEVTRPGYYDEAPSFDPRGRYLYFLSRRTFDPVPDQVRFDWGFPKTLRPYAVTLRAADVSPFLPRPRPVGDSSTDQSQGEKSKPETAAATQIDLDGIDRRIVGFPVPEERYTQVIGLGDKVLLVHEPVEGARSATPFDSDAPSNQVLSTFDLTTQQHDTLGGNAGPVVVSANRRAMLYRTGNRARVLPAGQRPPDDAGDEPSRSSGWIDLDRITVAIDPAAEWRQMLAETWRLQREYFWVPDYSGVDWPAVRDRYAPLADRVTTRAEFSDLLWEMQGELGTSHAYELGGDYREAPPWKLGYLGADFAPAREPGLWRISHIVQGDSWDAETAAPLAAPGVNLRVGDTVLAVNGQPVPADVGPGPLLVNRAGQTIELTVAGPEGENPRHVMVTTLADERAVRYREWVESNRARVHEATGGRVGYIHIPNMGPLGFAEFHRGYLAELHRDALIVDIRFNGGGNVSQLLLEKLARRRIGYSVSRWKPPEPYVEESPAGPLVCLTNEHAGSDGDIFAQAFSLLGLGPVVGTRTWGGVVGINPTRRLADGTIVTQPEEAFWFNDVGWGVENHGAVPDIECEITPQDYAAGRDPQLDEALTKIEGLLRQHRAPHPDGSERPRRAAAPLPSRVQSSSPVPDV